MNRQTMTQDVLGQGVESCNYMSDVDLVHFAFCLLQVHMEVSMANKTRL